MQMVANVNIYHLLYANSNDYVLLPQTSHIVTLVGLSTWFLEWLENVLDKHTV